jgi:hypothetical protein
VSCEAVPNLFSTFESGPTATGRSYELENAAVNDRNAQGAGIRDWLCKRAKSDPKATFEPQRNCPLPFLQRSLREQREPVLMTRSSIP